MMTDEKRNCTEYSHNGTETVCKSPVQGVLMDDEMDNLCDSISEYGVLSPLMARLINDGEYEIISGHRRKATAKKSINVALLDK